MEEESWRSNLGRVILEEESWRSNLGGVILEEESWKRKLGGVILAEESWRRHLGGTLGALWGHFWSSVEALKRLSGRPGPRRHLGGKSDRFHCVLRYLSSRPTVSRRRDESKCHQVL